MDRRDFLKLFVLSAAGLYVPKTSYFFMPKQPVQLVSNMVWMQEDEKYGHWVEAPPGEMSYISPSEINVNGVVYKYDSCKILALGENRANIPHMIKVVWSKYETNQI